MCRNVTVGAICQSLGQSKLKQTDDSLALLEAGNFVLLIQQNVSHECVESETHGGKKVVDWLCRHGHGDPALGFL